MSKKDNATAVLFVEDEPLLGEVVSEALSDRGFAVHLMHDADHALDHLRSGAPVDVLLTDIDLGDGIDGTALAALARAQRPSLPVVYVSGRARSISQIAAVPGSVFIPKPYSVSEVGAALERLVHRGRSLRAA